MSVDCAEPVRAAAKLLSAEPTLLQSLAIGRLLGHVRTLSALGPELRPKASGRSTRSAEQLMSRVLHLQPAQASAPLVAARRALRDDPFEAHAAGSVTRTQTTSTVTIL